MSKSAVRATNINRLNPKNKRWTRITSSSEHKWVEVILFIVLIIIGIIVIVTIGNIYASGKAGEKLGTQDTDECLFFVSDL